MELNTALKSFFLYYLYEIDWISLMDTEYFDVVNYRDDVVGRESRSKVHQGRLLHRAVHVFVRSEKQDWVLQQRSAFKDLDPLT